MSVGILRRDGFTLLELLVVVLVLAVLIAVAAPSFLGQTEKAHESAAKQNLSQAYKAAKAATVNEATTQGSYADLGVAALVTAIDASEPQFALVEADDAAYAAAEIDVSLDGTTLVLRTLAGARVCTLRAVENGALEPVTCTTSSPAPTPAYDQVVLADAPVGYWRLGESQGPVVDATGNGNGASAFGGVTFGATSLLTSDSNTAVSLNGSDAYLASATPLIPAGVFSVEMWVQFTTVNDKAFVTQYNNYTAGRFVVGLDDSTGKPYLQIGPNYVLADTALVAGQPYHLVVTRDAANLVRFYVNGQPAGSNTLSGAVDQVQTEIGRINFPDQADSFSAFTADEIAFYTSVLDASRVQAHYDAR